jgi:hypothetical protein
MQMAMSNHGSGNTALRALLDEAEMSNIALGRAAPTPRR